jgi:hypothetical protein
MCRIATCISASLASFTASSIAADASAEKSVTTNAFFKATYFWTVERGDRISGSDFWISHRYAFAGARLFSASLRLASVSSSFSSNCLLLALPAHFRSLGSLRKKNHEQAKDQQDDPPAQVNIHVQRVLVDRRAHRSQPEQDQQRPKGREEKANRYTNVKAHSCNEFKLVRRK